ncbi:MAG TPA: helicase-related protein, partial [Lachnospiraceae bacterium]
LQYDTLKKHGLDHFDKWASTFAQISSDLELAPEGTGFLMRQRLSKFHNLVELMTLFHEFADVKIKEVLNLPTPEATYELIKTKPTKEQREILKSLVKRADDIRNRKASVEEDNMLKVTMDGKKLAIDQRILNPMLPDDPSSKLNACVNNVYRIWKDSRDKRSTQLIFCDTSTPKADGSFNVYQDVKQKLIARGVPAGEIAFIHDASNDKKREELLDKVRGGEIRILMGSTEKMGAGMNVQEKLVALHDLDVPWRPSDLEQRAGRIERRGNENEEVFIYRYITEDTFDGYLWQTLEQKQQYISQVVTNKSPIRVMEDVDQKALSFAEIKALALGDPRLKEKMDLDIAVNRLRLKESAYKKQKYDLEDKVLRYYPDEIERLKGFIEGTKEDIQNVEKITNEDGFTSITIQGQTYYDKKQGGEKLLEEISFVGIEKNKIVGNYRNFAIEVSYNMFSNAYDFVLVGKARHHGEFGTSADGNILRMDNVIERLEGKLERFTESLSETYKQLEFAKENMSKPFEQEDELKEKIIRLNRLNLEIDLSKNKEEKEESLEEGFVAVEEENLEKIGSVYDDDGNIKEKEYLTEGEIQKEKVFCL